MKKSGFIYLLTLITAIIVGFLTNFVENHIIKSAVYAAGILAALIWIFHFNSIKYTISEKILTIKSGIIFKKTKIIPLDKVLLKSSYAFGKTVFLTIIRTAGSFAVIFGEI